MIIAIPSSDDSGLGSDVFPHFGRCPFYTIIDTENQSVRIIENSSIHTGGKKSPPELLSDEGVDALVCDDLGRKAVFLFKDLSIEVYVGAKGTIKDAFESWKEGRLDTPKKEYNCKGHGGETK
jgi:predicted Fe-Mo cluster-binding NifX family protein